MTQYLDITKIKRLLGNTIMARELVSRCRWPNGPVCIECKSKEVRFIKDRQVYYCTECRKQFSLKIDTLFAYSSLTLSQWLVALYIIMYAPKARVHKLAVTLKVSQPTASFLRRYLKAALSMIPETTNFEEALTSLLVLNKPQIIKKMHHQKPRLKRKKTASKKK